MLYDPKWKPPVEFKTPTQLDIPEDVYDALVKALHVLESGRMPPGHRFHMNVWQSVHGVCGTVCCIGGLANTFIEGNDKYYIMSVAKRQFFRENAGQLYSLFFPHRLAIWQDITQAHGAMALRNYLTYGETRWETVMPDNLRTKFTGDPQDAV